MDQNKKKLVYGIIVIVSVLLVILGSSYAFWVFTFEGNKNTGMSKCFKLDFIEDKDSKISLLEGYPISDEDGKVLTPYKFKIVNKCDKRARYTIRLELEKTTSMNEKYIKSMLNEGSIKRINELKTTEPSLSSAKSSYILEEKTMNGNSEEEYELRLWIDGSVTSDNKEVMDKIFEGKITVEGDYDERYQEALLNGTDPVLGSGLIPVIIADNGVVRKADETKEWYRYENKEWANAVILNDESIRYENGEEIPESNIESYFVWIPRYRYQIFDNGMYYELSDNVENRVQEIKIEFENKDTQLSKGTKKGNWLTHPAFTSFDTNGLWVGKFETGYKGSSDKTSAEVNQIEPESIQIKPGVNSWRGIQVANAFYSTYDYKRELDSHMMKNTEWGAIAYLQHSKYGSMASVRINNYEGFVTGYASTKEPTCGYTGTNEECNKYGTDSSITKPYNTEVGYLASTTGNISGVYDMAGGAWEYMMGVMADKSGNPMSGSNNKYNSGFNGVFGSPGWNGDTSGLTTLTTGKPFSDFKYYDLYSFSDNFKIYYRGILGDATGEMGPFGTITYENSQTFKGSWYDDEANFVTSVLPWCIRGSYFLSGLGSGIFNFGATHGSAVDSNTFRVVLGVR